MGRCWGNFIRSEMSNKIGEIGQQVLDDIQEAITMMHERNTGLHGDNLRIYIPTFMMPLLFESYDPQARITTAFGHRVLPNWDKTSIVVSDHMSMKNEAIIIKIT